MKLFLLRFYGFITKETLLCFFKINLLKMQSATVELFHGAFYQVGSTLVQKSVVIAKPKRKRRMATESPMAMVESSRVGEWPSSKHAAAFEFPLKNMAAEQSGILLMGQRCIGDQADIVPNRSGSAPPNMEGSLASIKNLLMQHSSRLNSSLANLGSSIESCVPEEQVRSDPAYFAYYTSNINLNPRLPPPLISQENRRLLHQIGVFGNNWELTSAEDSGSGSLHLSGGSLSAHKEECEDDTSSRVASDNLAESSTAPMPGQDTISLSSRHKSLVDLIQVEY